MPQRSADHRNIARDSASARTKLLVSLGAAVAGGAAAAVAGAGRTAPLIGWDILALVLLRLGVVRRMEARRGVDASHATREDPSRDLADLVMLGAAIASLVAVGAVLFGAGPPTEP